MVEVWSWVEMVEDGSCFNCCLQDKCLIADIEVNLCTLLSKFDRICDQRKSWVNVGRSEVMKYARENSNYRIELE